MDFWEGLLIGPIWADTNFSERKHRGFYLILGSLCALFLLAFQFLSQLQQVFPMSPGLYLLITLALVFGLPFASARYHGLMWPLRVIILMAYGLQYGAAFAFVVKLMNALPFFNTGDVLVKVSEAVNRLMNDLSGFFAFLGSLSASLAAVLLGGFILFIFFVLLFLLFVSIPLLYFRAIRSLQRLVDRMVLRQFYKDRLRF